MFARSKAGGFVPEFRAVCSPEAKNAPLFPETLPEGLCHPHALKLAWAAGFIDGDGCVTAVIQRHQNRITPSVRIRVVIVQNDHYVLQVLKNVLGESGALNALKRQPCQNRQPYQLQYDSGHAIAVLKKIRPYLVRKAREADACMELFIEGKLDKMPGPKGFPPEVLRIRYYWVGRIGRLK
jgi:hypothetical protein